MPDKKSMISQAKTVYLYVFDIKDGQSTDDRLKTAARNYFARNMRDAGGEEILCVKRTERGKPYLPNCGGLGVSVSHSGDRFICALTEGEVGVDLQEHRVLKSETKEDAAVRFKKMARRFYHTAEAEFVDSNAFYRFFAVWTAKESFVKYTGRGIDNTFSEFSVLPENLPDAEALDCGKPFRWYSLGKAFYSMRFDDNYTLCICADSAFDVMVIDLRAEI